MGKKLNEKQFREVVRNIIKESVKDLGDSMNQDLNTMDSVNTTDHPNTLIGAPENTNDPSQSPVDTKKENDKDAPETPKTEQLKESKGDVENAGEVTDVDMNSQDSELGDHKDGAVVEVEAGGGTHSGESTKGMAKAKEETKSGMNDSSNENGGDDKGAEATETKMNAMDKEVDEGTKTYVEAGSEDSTGQKDAKWSKEAKNEKADEPIATAIQLPEGFGKKAISSSELLKFINEEADKLSDKGLL